MLEPKPETPIQVILAGSAASQCGPPCGMADRAWGGLSPHQIAGAQALLPDPITCYSESRYVQRQKVALDVGGSVVSVDWLTAGRFANGERWDFERRVIA